MLYPEYRRCAYQQGFAVLVFFELDFKVDDDDVDAVGSGLETEEDTIFVLLVSDRI